MNEGNPSRIIAIDLARGIAITLMILSHGVKGLLSFEQFPNWGLVPLHLITKFSSTMFFIVFGISLAVSFAPVTMNAERWSLKRRRLLIRALTILFWYKVLTFIELSHLHGPSEILDALLYRSFPSYAEILGFYAIALLWIPWVLPLWQKSGLALRISYPIFFTALAWTVTNLLEGTSWTSLKALLVEDSSTYTWGQLTRTPLVFFGLLVGGLLPQNPLWKDRRNLAWKLALGGLVGLAVFLVIYWQELSATLFALAQNHGKHPPNFAFMLFSTAGALIIIGLSFLVNKSWARWMTPLTLIGRDPLTAFVFHISFLFLVYRQLLNLWLQVNYLDALALTFLLIAMTAGVIKLKIWRNKYEATQISPRRGPYSAGLKPRELSSH